MSFTARLVGPYRAVRDWIQGRQEAEETRALLGSIRSAQVRAIQSPASLHELEFRVFSQFGDDGILQWLVSRLPEIPKTFVEFGVEDYMEATTRFLLVNDNWSGLVMDGSERNMARLRSRPWYWRYDLTALPRFLTRHNVDTEIGQWLGERELGLLHIDVDGNDYWLWEAVTCARPAIVVVEYNASLGNERPVSIPYADDFDRLSAHASGQYFGTSLLALRHLAAARGYAFLGTNSAGNNAYFLLEAFADRPDFATLTATAGFTAPKFRDGRDAEGRLDHGDHEARKRAIRGLPLHDVVSGRVEPAP